MQSQTLKRYLRYSLLVASLTLSAASAKSQERKALPVNDLPIIQNNCPGNLVTNGNFTNGITRGAKKPGANTDRF